MNPADRFMEAFPHAAESNGWSKNNLARMVRDATRLKITDDEFQDLTDSLLRRPRRTSTPQYHEVYAAMEAIVRERASGMTDSTVQRLRDAKAEYRPWSDAERAWRKEVVTAMKDGRRAPDLHDFVRAWEATT